MAVVSAILFVFTVCSFAQEGNPPVKEGAAAEMEQQSGVPGRGEHFIQKFDKDKDGKVSKDEFPGPAERFPQMDKNGDGFITADEVQAGRPPRMGGIPDGTGPKGMGLNFIRKFDKDNDGKVSKDEFPGPAEHFSNIDKNGDGFVTADEVQAGRPPRMGGTQGTPGQMDGTGPKGMGQNFIRRFDKDNDGKVSKDEFSGRTDRFTRLDKNGDGFITEDEMSQQLPAPQTQGQQN